MPQPPATLNTFEALLRIVADLRGPAGCPWDKEQTHTSLTPYAIEETHEMVEAIESGDDAHICEELGDVLFQVILHAQLAKERGAFEIKDVIEGIAKKVVRRHPHVFSDVKVTNSDEVMKNWDEIKKKEKKNSPPKSPFDMPKSLPALHSANVIGEKTRKYRFDWNEPSAVLTQLKSEISELEQALNTTDPQRQKHLMHEIGDVLFSAAQLARHVDIDAEASLREANRRFVRRFGHMVTQKGGLDSFIATASDEKEQLWREAKANEKT